MRRPAMREAGLERAFVRAVKKAGGEARKLVTPGRRHACDRIVLWPAKMSGIFPRMTIHPAAVEFVELKKPGEKPRPGQLRELKRLRDRGFKAFVIDSQHDIQIYVEGR